MNHPRQPGKCGATGEPAAQPILNQRSNDIQPLGTVVKYPLALADDAKKAITDALNQILADSIYLREMYRKSEWQTTGPRSTRCTSCSTATGRSRTDIVQQARQPRTDARGRHRRGAERHRPQGDPDRAASERPRGAAGPALAPPRGPRGGPRGVPRGGEDRRSRTATTAPRSCSSGRRYPPQREAGVAPLGPPHRHAPRLRALSPGRGIARAKGADLRAPADFGRRAGPIVTRS